MKKILDAATGELLLSELPIRPRATEAELTAALSGHVLTRENPAPHWKWARIRNLQVGDEHFIFGFCFEDDRLRMVDFVVSPTPFGTSSWDDWKEDEERALVATYDAWLDGQIGKERAFPWGDVWASFDPRSAGTSMGLRYR